VVLARAGYPPHEGRALVFIVRDAHELTIQAANSLLKTLEEPGDKNHFILLTSRENRLLDTIRSRTLAVRFGPLADDIVARILREHGADDSVAPLAQGSAALALDLGEVDRMKSREDFLAQARAALAAPDLATAIDLARDRKDTRDVLRESLAFFAQALAVEARERISDAPQDSERAAQRYAVVLATIGEVERNVQPTLALEAMVTRLRRV
jgi:DNA polymerase-3 subunit delta'